MMDFSTQQHVDTTASVQDRIKFLKHCADLYETNGSSPITDAEYDREYYELESLCPDDPFFTEIGGMDEKHVYGTTVKHEIIMGSLSKCPDIESFDQWLKSNFSSHDIPSFVLQHKVDGLSLSLLYKNGHLVRALTRGTGTEGIDVTANAQYVTGVLQSISCQDEVEIRGECYKKRGDFYANWHGEKSEGKYKNPRNFTAGSLNQKNPSITKQRGLNFVAYEVVRKQFQTERDKLRFIVENGFPNLKSSTKQTLVDITSLDKIVQAVRVYMDGIDRKNLEYDIDGIVVKMNNCAQAKKMGSVSGGKKPRAHRAVKFPPVEKETKVVDVIPQVGRTGAIIPVGILEPVDLEGSVITRATLHNYRALETSGMKVGSRVVIAKKGDIIPQIIRIVDAGTGGTLAVPQLCPACSHPLTWDANRVHLVCENPICYSQLTARIEHWLKKLGVKGIGKGILNRLTDENELQWEGRPIITSLPEMYYMLDNDRKSEHPFRKYEYLKEQFGEKAYQNIVDAVHSVRKADLETFIRAIGISGIGSMAKDIVAIAPTIDDIDQLTVEDLEKLEGFGYKKAEGFVNGWNSLRQEINQLLKYIDIKQPEVASNALDGKKFCFTGSFSDPSRKEMEKMVGLHGGKVASVSKNLTALVWDEETTKGKYQKATDLGINIINQNEFLEMLEKE